MNLKYTLCAIALAAVVTPALAAGEFYVVQDTSTKKCSIVEVKPTTATSTLVGSIVYKTQAEAQTGMAAEKICAAK